jgi:CheY-like chemotaxis protein
VRQLISDLVTAGDKAAQLTHQMLAYSGRGRFIVEPGDLSALVREILPLVSHAIPPTVSVDLALEAGLPPVECDKAQMQQVILNLLINAAEACGSQPGMIHVSTTSEAADARRLQPSFGLPPVQPGVFVRLEVRDTGSGMTAEVKAKIFDPFFTTKFTGRGLGLSAVLGIVRAHHGAIEVDSTPGKGSAFRIFFSISRKTFPAAADSKAEVLQQSGGATILVVDDEEVTRRTASRALQKYGYRVLTADSGRAALQIFQRMHREIDLVILDLTMPVMGGEATLAGLKQINSAVRIVLSSGYGAAEVTARFEGRGLAGFLQKPYTAAGIIQEVQSILRSNSARWLSQGNASEYGCE